MQCMSFLDERMFNYLHDYVHGEVGHSRVQQYLSQTPYGITTEVVLLRFSTCTIVITEITVFYFAFSNGLNTNRRVHIHLTIILPIPAMTRFAGSCTSVTMHTSPYQVANLSIPPSRMASARSHAVDLRHLRELRQRCLGTRMSSLSRAR
ncbi:hypothetical protein EDC04DRAFT_1406869 [Pisolithus marmoratus]|nr:hypothetical protein EDC04DRAFT_1406869 [Pisolithus marmoratus]